MSETKRNSKERRCPVCGRGKLKRRLMSEVFEYGPDGDAVLVKTQDVPVEDCDTCGESFSGPEAARIRHEAIGMALGLVPSREIRAIRERLGKSLEQFARLIGVKRDQLFEWENGSALQDRTADRLLRLVALKHENMQYLESIPDASPREAEHPSSEIQTKSSKKSVRQVVRLKDRKQSGV